MKSLLTNYGFPMITTDVMKLGSVRIEVNIERCNASFSISTIRLGTMETSPSLECCRRTGSKMS